MVDRASKLVRDLTDQPIQGTDALDALRRFASEFGWRPSDQLDRYPGTERFCNGHLVVEHGFDLTAVISFLRTDTPYGDLVLSERRTLLELSYNNLVDVHLLPERSGMRVVFNRTDPPQDQFFPATFSEDVWRADAFDRLTGKRPNPNVKALDDALIETVRFWKRAIRSDMGEHAGLPQLSAMINSVIMVRALEDYRNRVRPSDERLLISVLGELPQGRKNAKSLISKAFERLDHANPPGWLRDILVQLEAFDNWDAESLRDLVGNFYRSRFSPYRYNFHLISKHALSRIYEHYVSVLRDNTPSDLMLFRDLPVDLRNKDLGSIYTPQYVAGFFARYLKEHRTPRSFRTLRTIDPACGSGMFLRTLLEAQCNPADDGFSEDSVSLSFANTRGIDVDPNACHATRLSLALLHLVLTGTFPVTLNVQPGEAIEILQQDPDAIFDVVVANPPFVKWDGLSPTIRERLSSYMLEQGFGKQDLYLAFLKAAIAHVAPGGVLAFVLPHSFLLSTGASKLRRQISDQFAIRILADLSEVPVFEQTGVYVILLIAERTAERHIPATVVKCQEFVGAALQDALAGRTRAGDGYQVFHVDQRLFGRERWHLLSSEEVALQDAIEAHPRLDQFVEVRQGLITGADEVFIRPSRDCPRAERGVWRPLLTDREMVRFRVPERQTTAVFMPFGPDGERLTEANLRKTYPDTWAYLKEFKAVLDQRSTVTKNESPWWEPAWPRSPAKLFVSKIVTPHLVLLPRFAIDGEGKYAISRSPYLVPKSESGGQSLLKIVCAVMNSAIGHWQLASSSHKYSRGYLMLEVKTLRDFHMPDPAKLPAPLTRRIVRLVDALSASQADAKAMAELDEAVGQAFGLSADQMSLVGVGS
jgi:type I restriction-modification system DNA methylase subunit